MFESGGFDVNTFYYNNVCFGRQEICVGSDDYNAIVTPPSKLCWTNHLVTGFSRDEYVSLSEDDALAPRRGDGSMPSRFARLMPGSRLVDAGGSSTGVGYSQLGSTDHGFPVPCFARFRPGA